MKAMKLGLIPIGRIVSMAAWKQKQFNRVGLLARSC